MSNVLRIGVSWALVTLTALLMPSPASAQFFALGKGGPALEPYDVDYSYLADPAKRTSLLDSIHYVPFDNGVGYVTFDGEAREQFWSLHNISYGLRTPLSNTYDLQRLLASAFIHADQHFGVFVQFGRYDSFDKVGFSSTDRDEGRLQQGFIQIKEKIEWADVTLQAGRQEITLGSGRFVWINDSSNVRTTHDGVRTNAVFANGTSVDLVYTRPNTPQIEPFDDFNSYAGTFGAAYVSEPLGATTHADEYYFYRHNIGGQYSGLTGNEERSTVGGRLWGSLGSLKYDGDFAYQFGTFNNLNISAFGGSGRALYTFEKTTWQPGVQFQGSYFSGGGGTNTQTIRTFSAPFPRPTLLNYIGLNTLENVIEAYPAFVVSPSRTLSLRFGPEVLWRASVDDAVYVSRMTPLPQTMSSTDKASFIGTNLVATAQWVPLAGVTIFAEYLHELPGPAITLAGGKAVDAGVLQTDYRF